MVRRTCCTSIGANNDPRWHGPMQQANQSIYRWFKHDSNMILPNANITFHWSHTVPCDSMQRFPVKTQGRKGIKRFEKPGLRSINWGPRRINKQQIPPQNSMVLKLKVCGIMMLWFGHMYIIIYIILYTQYIYIYMYIYTDVFIYTYAYHCIHI